MNNQKEWQQCQKWFVKARKLCAEVGTEDAVDPLYLARQREENQHNKRKIRQLCRETERLVSLVLSGEVSDPLIQDLQVLHVSPESNGPYLMITLCHPNLCNTNLETQILTRLQRLEGYLRSVITQSVCRKRVPRLKFKLDVYINKVVR